MRFAIAKGTKKRRIEAPFGICGSREDFEQLRRQIDGWLSDPGNGCGISYGWLFVHPKVVEMGPLNSPPEEWDAE